jgi:CBS domain-containing protein
MLMEKITDILSRKKNRVTTVSPFCPLSDALCQMNCQNVDYLVVIDDDDRFQGIISEHDITSKIMFGGKSFDKAKVKDVINNCIPYVTVNDTVESCMRKMLLYKARYVPVLDDFTFIGIISAADIIEEAVYNRFEIFDTEHQEESSTYYVL